MPLDFSYSQVRDPSYKDPSKIGELEDVVIMAIAKNQDGESQARTIDGSLFTELAKPGADGMMGPTGPTGPTGPQGPPGPPGGDSDAEITPETIATEEILLALLKKLKELTGISIGLDSTGSDLQSADSGSISAPKGFFEQ